MATKLINVRKQNAYPNQIQIRLLIQIHIKAPQDFEKIPPVFSRKQSDSCSIVNRQNKCKVLQ